MSTKCWTIGFAGKGDVTTDNAWGHLDHWLPEDAEIQALIPERIPRTLKGLRTVATLLEKEFDIPQIEYTDSELITQLIKADAEGEFAALVVLGIEDDATTLLACKALDAGIVVKDLCAAMDDVEFEPDPPPPARQRRGKTVQAEAAEPATITPATRATRAITDDIGIEPGVAAQLLLDQAIRNIVREELTMFPGVHASVEVRGAPAETAAEDAGDDTPRVRAYVTPDGTYRAATKRSRKKVGEDEVELSEAEARELNLIE